MKSTYSLRRCSWGGSEARYQRVLGRLSIFMVVLLAPSLAAVAQGRPGTGGVDYEIAVTPIYQPEVDISGGGGFTRSSALARFRATGSVSKTTSVGVTVKYDSDDYDFSGVTEFGGANPWNHVSRFGIGVPLFVRLGSSWSAGVTPSVDWIREDGAESSEALAYGVTMFALRSFDRGRRIGLGAAFFKEVDDDTAVFPLLAVDWRFNEHWRLANPFDAEALGPAGLELSYRFNDRWQLGGGGVYRSFRFRLDREGVAPGGIGENKGIASFLRLRRTPETGIALDLYVGAFLDGELSLKDVDGNTISSSDYDTAPFAAVTVSMKF